MVGIGRQGEESQEGMDLLRRHAGVGGARVEGVRSVGNSSVIEDWQRRLKMKFSFIQIIFVFVFKRCGVCRAGGGLSENAD